MMKEEIGKKEGEQKQKKRRNYTSSKWAIFFAAKLFCCFGDNEFKLYQTMEIDIVFLMNIIDDVCLLTFIHFFFLLRLRNVFVFFVRI